jgi:hypothetical protein
MHVRRVASQKHPSLSVGSRLPSHVGKSGKPSRVTNTEVRPVNGDERIAEVLQRWLVVFAGVRFDQHNAHSLAILQLA